MWLGWSGWRSIIHGSWIMGLVGDGDGDGWVWLERAGFFWVSVGVGYTFAESKSEVHRLRRTKWRKVIISTSTNRNVIFVLFS